LQRWIMSCTRAAGQDTLAIIDVLVLHHIGQRPGGERLADVRFALDVEDAHVVAYSVRKLRACGLVAAARMGKDKMYSLTGLGREHVERYAALHEQRLLAQLQEIEPDRLQELGRYFKTMSGLYDQAARAASSL
jgi:predicted MarR family transcription regulator